MTFSEFAKMMRKYIFTEDTATEFVKNLVGAYMEEPYAEADIEDSKKDMYNPMGYSKKNNKDEDSEDIASKYDSSLQKIYNGTANIPKTKVNRILSHKDEYKFQDYIKNNLSLSALGELEKELKEVYNNYDDEMDVGKNCASLFTCVLKDILENNNGKSNRKPKIQTKTKVLKDISYSELPTYELLPNDETIPLKDDWLNDLEKSSSQSLANDEKNSPAKLSVPPQVAICFCCKNWSGNRPDTLEPNTKMEGKCLFKYNSKARIYTCGDTCTNFSPDNSLTLKYIIAMSKTQKPVSENAFKPHSKNLSLKLKKYRKSQPTLI